ncbi:MAG TPA: hypothetical protein VD772_01455, partial [Anseongella sp.]|nr:hypothetical protein [Anseongella sp.]
RWLPCPYQKPLPISAGDGLAGLAREPATGYGQQLTSNTWLRSCRRKYAKQTLAALPWNLPSGELKIRQL